MPRQIFNDVAVVGMFHRERDGVPAKAIVSNFVPPLTLDLEREPLNQYDSYAIKVLYQGQHIGYIEAISACYIAPHMDEGKPFTCRVVRLETRKNNLHPICTIEEDQPDDAAPAAT